MGAWIPPIRHLAGDGLPSPPSFIRKDGIETIIWHDKDGVHAIRGPVNVNPEKDSDTGFTQTF